MSAHTDQGRSSGRTVSDVEARSRRGRRSRPLVATLSAVAVSAAGIGIGIASAPPVSAALIDPAPGLPPFYDGLVTTSASPRLFKAFGGRNPDEWFPVIQAGQSFSALANGQADAKRAKIAIRLPTTLTAVNLVGVNTLKPTAFNKKHQVTADAQVLRVQEGFVYVKSPQGMSPAYGLLPEVTITTLAFGILPATVTLSLAQPRENVTTANPAGTPVPLFANVYQDAARNIVYDASVKGPLNLTVSGLSVDGRKVDVGSTCRTVTPGQISLVGKQSIGLPPPGYYHPVNGGDLYGTLSVPTFAGCRGATGEDLSALVTNALSGDTTSVHLNQASLGGTLGCTLKVPTGALIPCGQPKTQVQPTGPGQVPATPPDWTPNPPPAPLPLRP